MTEAHLHNSKLRVNTIVLFFAFYEHRHTSEVAEK